MPYKNIIVENDHGTVILTINRPDQRNALDPETRAEIQTAVSSLKHDSTARVLIITGAGGKAFAAGADLKDLQRKSAIDMMESDANDQLFDLTNLPIPVIAAIDGYALGGGWELALSCDIRIASRKSKVGQPEVKLGIIASSGGISRLWRFVGPGKAKELLFTGDVLSAEEAREIGMIERVVDDGTVMDAAKEMAERIKANAPLAVSLTKMAVNVSMNVDLKSALVVEKYFQALAFATEDKQEGTTAFIGKRPPVYRRR